MAYNPVLSTTSQTIHIHVLILLLSLGEKSAKNAVTPLVEAFQRF
ncbi:MAG: hypothetical protein HPY66_1766 [Firmicutes bacterium]|nr:hypothetical protein [Bacillota bacterium]